MRSSIQAMEGLTEVVQRLHTMSMSLDFSALISASALLTHGQWIKTGICGKAMALPLVIANRPERYAKDREIIVICLNANI